MHLRVFTDAMVIHPTIVQTSLQILLIFPTTYSFSISSSLWHSSCTTVTEVKQMAVLWKYDKLCCGACLFCSNGACLFWTFQFPSCDAIATFLCLLCELICASRTVTFFKLHGRLLQTVRSLLPDSTCEILVFIGKYLRDGPCCKMFYFRNTSPPNVTYKTFRITRDFSCNFRRKKVDQEICLFFLLRSEYFSKSLTDP